MTHRYRTASRELLEKARGALEQDNLVQASEKGWGAAAQAVKAIAEGKRRRHSGHRLLFETIRRLSEGRGDRRIHELFLAANALHMNFCENWMPRESVAVALEDVQELIETLEPAMEQA